MITLQKLKWGYLFSYGDSNEIDFTKNVVTQILGVNGNGKSSLALILEEALYNKNSKGIKKGDIPNRYADKGYWLTLQFTKNDDLYLIDIDRKSNIKVKLYENGIDVSSHTATNTFKHIESIMGMDFKMFSQLVYQNTNTSLQFLVATDTNRKKFLIDLLKLDHYVQLFEVFKEAVKTHSTTVTKLESQVQTIENWLVQNKLESEEKLPILDTDSFDTHTEEQEATKLSIEISNIDRSNKLIESNTSYKKLLDAINIEEIQAIEASYTSYDSEQSVLGGLVSDKQRISAYIKKIESLGNTCHTCEQTIQPELKAKILAEERDQLNDTTKRIAEVEAAIAAIKSGNIDFKYKQDKIKEWEGLYQSVNKGLPSDFINKEDLVAELSNISIRISNVKEKLKLAIAHNQKAAHNNSRIEVFKEQSEKFILELEKCTESLKEEQTNLNHLELLKKSFSTNGLIAYKIENLVKDLEELTNEYLGELSDGRFTIEFTVSNDKLNVLITDNGITVDILALSSGELARVNTATLLALRKLMNSISKSKINVLFLDEVIAVLDEPGRERLVEVLMEEDLNTFIVSHSWSHPLLAKLEVIKDGNVSKLEVD